MSKKDECLKALQCLYLEVDSTIADDVKKKVLEALDEAENRYSDNEADGIVFCGKCGKQE